jgi:hypothetical protein
VINPEHLAPIVKLISIVKGIFVDLNCPPNKLRNFSESFAYIKTRGATKCFCAMYIDFPSEFWLHIISLCDLGEID